MNQRQTDVEAWICRELFNAVPMSIAVIDREGNIVYANRAFERFFGEWAGRKCFAAYKNRDAVCPDCIRGAAFADGESRVREEAGCDNTGRPVRYLKHTLPMRDELGAVRFVIEMSTDITEVEEMRQEYRLIFDQVPCSILVINRDFQIVKANQRIRRMYGDIKGRNCFEVLKDRSDICPECTARLTFADGRTHTGHHVWKSALGKTIQQHVATHPLRRSNGRFDEVMEMAVDVTESLRLEDELKIAHAFMESLIATSIDGIIAMEDDGGVTIVNPAARRIFNLPEDHDVSGQTLSYMLPEGFLDRVMAADAPQFLPETWIRAHDETERPVRLAGVRLQFGGRPRGLAFFIQDLREVKQLEKEKLDAERLAAVGATVAGLAHGVKNLITALEGGIYMLNTGFTKGNAERIGQGMDMLNRNVSRISMFVKAFLSFSKGRQILAKLNDPVAIAREVVELYAVKASMQGVELSCEPGDVRPAPLDYEGMHECLTNLVGNAIDACQTSDDAGACQVRVRIFDEGDALVYEVIDSGCGMDYQVKQKVFTTFFTTKGLGGTGLGLLMTKKIVHEHGGTIDLESAPGKGTTFRIRLPRTRLPEAEETSNTQSA